MMAVLSDVDWKQILQTQKVPYTDEIFRSVDAVKTFFENAEKYTSGEKLKDAGKKAKEKGSEWWNKAKEIISE